MSTTPPSKKSHLLPNALPFTHTPLIIHFLSYLPQFPYHFLLQRVCSSFQEACETLFNNHGAANEAGVKRITIDLDLFRELARKSKRSRKGVADHSKVTTTTGKAQLTHTILHNIFTKCSNATELEFRNVQLSQDILNLLHHQSYSFKKLLLTNVQYVKGASWDFHFGFESIVVSAHLETFSRIYDYKLPQKTTESTKERFEFILNNARYFPPNFADMDQVEQMEYFMKRFVHHRLQYVWPMREWADLYFYNTTKGQMDPFLGSLVCVFGAIKPLYEHNLVHVNESLLDCKYTMPHILMEQVICKCPCFKPQNQVPMQLRYENWFNSRIVQDAKDGLTFLIRNKHFAPLAHKTHAKATILHMAYFLDHEISSHQIENAFGWEDFLVRLMRVEDQKKWGGVKNRKMLVKEDVWAESQG
mmetsp:Transcript_8150/g.30185  ORF Transcript_8150/g.30185 Transcript_8150/m.30185 type:complete len:417 (+) Transcript_8150:1-1251(+)